MTDSIYDFSVPSSTGDEISLREHQGKVMLIVNTASKCGFTPQYTGLQELHDQFRDQGLVIIALPCNQFGGQEPGSNAEVQEFCQLNYGLSFPVMGKIEVNGAGQHPLYAFLKDRTDGLLGSAIKWNFTKFLVWPDGTTVKRYGPQTSPGEVQQISKSCSSPPAGANHLTPGIAAGFSACI